MSAGTYLRSRYQATYAAGAIHPIRVQPETVAAATGATTNAAPAGAVTATPSARVQGGRRTRGLIARSVTLQLTGTPPATYKTGSITRIPCLTPTFFAAVSSPGTIVNYLGTTWEVVGVSAEVAR